MTALVDVDRFAGLALGDPRTPDNSNQFRREAFYRLSSAASRWSDLRRAAAVAAPGDPAKVAAADAYTFLVDCRAAHCLACHNIGGGDIGPSGILTVEATVRERRRRGNLCGNCGRKAVPLRDAPTQFGHVAPCCRLCIDGDT